VKVLRSIAFTLFIIGQMSCSTIQRSPASGYSEWNDNYANEESVYEYSFTQTGRERRKKSDVELMESGLRTQSDRDYYELAKPILKTEKDRKEFLMQKDRTAQKRWLASRGISENSLHEVNIKQAIDEGDLILGMSKEAVLMSWGDPEAVDVAGNPDYGIERWLYNHYEGSPEGYQKQERLIYFERGKVVGWETH